MKFNRCRFGLFFGAAIVVMALISFHCAGSGSAEVNIADQPGWGPVGYDHADYYYFPEIDCYYSISDHRYMYRDGTEWKTASTLPASYGTFDPYHSYKVVVNRPKPFEDNDNHKTQYSKYKDVRDQPVIRDSKDPKYFESKDHPQHDAWVKDHH
jgi:hypothetical protein